MHYRVWGERAWPPVVLLHGIAGSGRTWDSLAVQLAHRGRRAIAPDARGHGESEWASEYGGDQNVSDLTAFIDAIELRSFALVGFSMGARTAYGYAARHPGRVGRLILVDRGPETMAAGSARVGARLADEREFNTLEQAVEQLQSRMPGVPAAGVRQRAADNLVRRSDGRWAWRYDPALRARQPQDADTEWALLPKLEMPTLVLRGTLSDVLSADAAQRMTREIPDCTLIEIEGGSHHLMLEMPDEVAAAVIGFLKL